MNTLVSTGERNKNFWNVKKPGSDSWRGATGYDSRGHAVFDDPAYSARACICTLRTYYIKLGLTTLQQIFGRYAPADDTQGSIPGAPANEPNAYADYVAKFAGVDPDEDLFLFRSDGSIANKARLENILRAMARYECGAQFVVPGKVVADGIELYERFRPR